MSISRCQSSPWQSHRPTKVNFRKVILPLSVVKEARAHKGHSKINTSDHQTHQSKCRYHWRFKVPDQSATKGPKVKVWHGTFKYGRTYCKNVQDFRCYKSILVYKKSNIILVSTPPLYSVHWTPPFFLSFFFVLFFVSTIFERFEDIPQYLYTYQIIICRVSTFCRLSFEDKLYWTHLFHSNYKQI